MNKYYYDLHVHSALSPCGDEDMSPNSIAGMASLKGLNIVALTDHNTCKNCPAFFKACEKQGIIPVAGMELTTAEEIHMVCLFPELSCAMAFGDEIAKKRLNIKNDPEIFGNQFIMDENDEIIGEEELLLSAATDISLEEAFALAVEYNGFAYPAHADKSSNSIMAVLGMFPEAPRFKAVELNASKYGSDAEEKLKATAPQLLLTPFIYSSDAHFLWDISEAVCFFESENRDISTAADVLSAITGKII